MRAAEPLFFFFFSLNCCMSLPVPAPVSAAERHFLPQPDGLGRPPSTIGNGAGLRPIPQECPGGRADNPEARSGAWTRSNTLRVVKLIGIEQKHMVCSLHAGLLTDGCTSAAIWVSGCVKLESMGVQSDTRQIEKKKNPSKPLPAATQLPGPRASRVFPTMR